MRILFFKRLLQFIVMYTQVLQSHGFAANTIVMLHSNETCRSISEIVDHSKSYVKQQVVSYDVNSGICSSNTVVAGLVNEVSSYCRLSIDESSCNDIICSRSQLFYNATDRKWVQASLLKKDDLLLSGDSTCKKIVAIHQVKEPFRLYVMHVENSHTFLVGIYGVVAHNSEISLIVGSGIAATLSGSGGGAVVGSFLGPVGTIAGIAIGCGIAFVVEKYARKKDVRHRGTLFEDSQGEPNKVPIKTVEDILSDTKPGKKTKGKTTQFDKKGTYKDALNDFESLGLSDTHNLPNGKEGKMGILPDGRTVNVRSESSGKQPTLEIYDRDTKKSVKIRYII